MATFLGKSCSIGYPCILFVNAMSICSFGCFPFTFQGREFGSNRVCRDDVATGKSSFGTR